LNNYKQALDLLSNGRATLEQLMHELGVNDPMTFKLWLDKECMYLKSLPPAGAHRRNTTNGILATPHKSVREQVCINT